MQAEGDLCKVHDPFACFQVDADIADFIQFPVSARPAAIIRSPAGATLCESPFWWQGSMNMGLVLSAKMSFGLFVEPGVLACVSVSDIGSGEDH